MAQSEIGNVVVEPARRSSRPVVARAIERLVVVNDFSTARGGASSLALQAIAAAHAAGLPVTLICGDMGQNAQVPHGVEVIALGGDTLLSRPRLASARKGLWDSHWRIAKEWIAQNDTPATVYHLHNWAQILSPSIFQALQPVRARLLLHAHDFALACPTSTYYDYGHSQICGLTPLSGACMTSNCDKRSRLDKAWRMARLAATRLPFDPRRDETPVVLLGEEMRPFFLRAGYAARALRVVGNPATPFTAQRVEAERNAEILFVGRVGMEKGVEDVATAAQTLGLTMRVLGEGPLRATLAQEYPNVIVEGWADRAALAKAAQRARLLVVPSRTTEPFGLVFCEAAASGLPIVMSSQSLMAAGHVARGVAWSVAGNDTQALTDLLRRLMRDDDAIAAASRAGFAQRAEIARSAADWATDLRALYSEILDRAASRSARTMAPRSGAAMSSMRMKSS